MAIATVEEARDAILTHFKTGWDADAATSGVEVFYDDFKKDLPTSGSWVTVNVKHGGFFRTQRTLGEVGGRRFTREGLVNVQIFTPFGDGLDKTDALVQVFLDIFEGKTTGANGVWFRNVRWRETGPESAWHQTNMTIEFEWDTIK